eukprot:429470_1
MSLASTLNNILEAAKLAERQYLEKVESQKKEILTLQSQVNELQQQLNSKHEQKSDDIDANISVDDMIDILDEIDQIEQKYDDNEDMKNDHENYIQNNRQQQEDEKEDKEKTKQFWDYLDQKLEEADIEYIKELVRKKEIKMDDVNSQGRNLLMLSTTYGSYELVAMCINLGADIDHQDNSRKTALKIAQESGYPDIEELILMNLLKTELGQRIENTTNDLLRKKGINNNFKRILNKLFAENKTEEKEDESYRTKAVSNTFLSEMTDVYKKEVLETLMRVTLKSIENKISFSDDILYIAFQYEVNEKMRNPVDTVLYQMIKNVILGILSDTKNKKDWYFLKNYILSSS